MHEDIWRPTGSAFQRRTYGYGIWQDDVGRFAVRLRIGTEAKFQAAEGWIEAHLIGQLFMHCCDSFDIVMGRRFY